MNTFFPPCIKLAVHTVVSAKEKRKIQAIHKHIFKGIKLGTNSNEFYSPI